MVFAHDKSQTCNNILQFAHVYAWAREHGRSAISMQFSYKNRFFRIRHTRHASLFWYLVAKYGAALKLIPTASFKTRDCDPITLEQKMLRHQNIIVFGWFVRYYDLVLKYRDEIVDLFTIDDKYTQPVEQMMRHDDEQSTGKVIRLGVHIRRGDYAVWCNGAFYYDNTVYARHILRFKELYQGDGDIHVYLSTNDPEVCASDFQALCPGVKVFHPRGQVPEDLHMLSQCDFLIGPPSTFSLVASMYRDIPFYRMNSKDEQNMTKEGFRRFDYWFRHINDL